jgi:hypothetical protein
MRVPPQWKIAEINKRCAAAFLVDLASRGVSTDDLCHLDIEQMGRVQCLSGVEQPLFHRFGRRRPQQRFK